MAKQRFPVGENFPDFHWDPELGLCPPDMLSVLHTRDLVQDIRLRRYVHQDTEEVIRVAIAGDTGLYAVALMKQLLEAQEPFADGPLHLEVFDKDPNAVSTAKYNLTAYERYMTGFSANVFEADWNEEALWRYLQQNPVHFLISNPPYLPTSHVRRLVEPGKEDRLRSAYTMTSPMALDGGSEGLDHVRTLLRRTPDVLVGEGPTGLFLRYSFHSDRGEVSRIIDESFGGTAHKSFGTFQGVGPSSLGQQGQFDLTGGDTRILETVAVRIRPVEDVIGHKDISRPQVEMSTRHSAALGGMVLSVHQCDELLALRRSADLSFAEEESLTGGLHYLAVKMGRAYSTSARNLYELPRWELQRLKDNLGNERVRKLHDMALKR